MGKCITSWASSCLMCLLLDYISCSLLCLFKIFNAVPSHCRCYGPCILSAFANERLSHSGEGWRLAFMLDLMARLSTPNITSNEFWIFMMLNAVIIIISGVFRVYCHEKKRDHNPVMVTGNENKPFHKRIVLTVAITPFKNIPETLDISNFSLSFFQSSNQQYRYIWRRRERWRERKRERESWPIQRSVEAGWKLMGDS